MNEADSFIERVWRAMRQVQADGFDVARTTVHVSRNVEMHLKIDSLRNSLQFDLAAPDGEVRAFGLPLKVDDQLTANEIVLRYEVKA